MKWSFWRRERRNTELREEIQAHLLLAEREALESGMKKKEAHHKARREFGNISVAEEVTRDMWGWRWHFDFFQDVRYAMRSFRQHPAFVVVALLTLALGIGATTVMFSLVDGVLLKPLPYPEPHRLVAVNGHTDGWNTKVYGEQKLAYPDFLDCQRESHLLDMAALVYNSGTLSAPGLPQYVDYFEISPEFFSVTRVPLALGRAFLPEEDRIGVAPVTILGYSFWQKRFEGRTDVLGSSIVLEQKQYTIVGVAPAEFRLYGDEPEIYTLVGQDPAGYLHNRAAQPVHVFGRLRPGATLAQAQAEIALTGNHLAQAFADTNKGRSLQVKLLHPDVGDTGSTLWLLLGAVGLVLLIACANVASLMLARAVSRERELAMRVALGASRGRLVRQCLTESALLGLTGGLLGIMLASVGLRPFLAFWPGDLPRVEEVQVDWRVLVFAVGISVLSGVLFGLAPAWRAPVREVEQILRSGARTMVGSSRRTHFAFVVSEMALAIVLLIAAGMLGRTLLHASSLDPGLDIRNLLVMRVGLSAATLEDPTKIPAGWQEVIERGRHVPGVDAVTAVDIVPMRQGNNQIGYSTTPDVALKEKLPMVLASSATQDYLKVMRIPLLEGRFFDDHDRLGSELVIVVDDALAKSAFGGREALGKSLWIPDMPCVQQNDKSFVDCSAPYKIIGVVGHVRYWGLAGDDQAQVRAQMYYPFAQVAQPFLRRWSQLMSIAVRTSVPPLTVVEPLRQELRGAAGDQVLYQVRTMEQLAHNSLALQRFLLLLFGIFATLALVLACIGIYGVLAYLTGQRVPEIGLRMALGASPTAVMWLVLRQSLGIILLGIGIGTAFALATGRVMERLVEGMQPISLSTFIFTIPFLVVAAMLASLLPARRASRVDPMYALRQE
ncbi:MAG TPA: ABC transporter permease [Candidatus Acidoferrum sp.]|nr:ABC transporter permease [Candidatus Acidoferrum sp.]